MFNGVLIQGDEWMVMAEIRAERKIPLDPPLRKGEGWPVLCAWCEAEGGRPVLRYIERAGSHGICKHHSQELINEYGRLRLRNDVQAVRKCGGSRVV